MTTQKTTEPTVSPKKETIIATLYAFVAQRSGMDGRNYGSRESFMGDYRRVLKDGKDARFLLGVISRADSITADDLMRASERAYSGRLSLKVREDGAVAVDYCCGQYFPTEYRAAVCAVCASVLWDYLRRNMPAPDGMKTEIAGSGPFRREYQTESYAGMSAGDYLRKKARREFGRSIGNRWFD